MISFKARSVDRELEARLEPAGDAGGRGKAERKWYGNGDEGLKIKASVLDVPDRRPPQERQSASNRRPVL